LIVSITALCILRSEVFLQFFAEKTCIGSIAKSSCNSLFQDLLLGLPQSLNDCLMITSPYFADLSKTESTYFDI